MKILLVGALSWHPERLRSMAERGHRFWGLWARSMAWDQGPYPALDDCITPLALGEAAKAIRDRRIDCVYSLFQVYHRRLWGPRAAGIDHDVWTLLRTLLVERERGAFDAPIVRHWGFDVQHVDPAVTRAFDGQIFCNREKRHYWTTPVGRGGCGVDAFAHRGVVGFLDSDRPKLEFMNDEFSDPMTRDSNEIHTVCIGRPFGIDYLAAARRGIHVHVYGNNVDDVYRMIALDLPLADARGEAALLRRFLHVHRSLQASGTSWEEIRSAKAGWVREFSRYDAGWSYLGSPLPWEPLDDRAAIPNRIGTYVLAGLPVISDRRPGYYRYDQLAQLGINIDLVDSDYDDLRSRLGREVRTRGKRGNALLARSGYSFDATIDPLLDVLERARTGYFAMAHGERSHFESRRTHLLHFNTSPDPRTAVRGLARRLLAASPVAGASPVTRLGAVWHVLHQRWRGLVSARKASRLARMLRDAAEPGAPAPAPRRREMERERTHP